MTQTHEPCDGCPLVEGLDELAMIPGPGGGQAMRVRAATGQQGFVRLEQMAYSAGMGWYVQKSMVIPGDMLRLLIAELRKADCLIPRREHESEPPRMVFPGPLRLAGHDEAVERRA